MSLIEKALFGLINGEKIIKSPIFKKEFKKENQQLKDLIELSSKVHSYKKEYIDRDINLLKQGLDGEKNVYYELKNSFIPMLCLHDIRLEYNGYIAQFDFIVITNKFIMILETKKLNGDIEITKDGDFIRYFKNNYGKVFKKEGMYSPISQNERHANILKEILVKEKVIKNYPIKTAVVIANPKTIINKSKAPKYIQNNIFKYDQITNLLKKELQDKDNTRNLLEKYMYEIADFLIQNNRHIKMDNINKYSLTSEDFIEKTIEHKEVIENNDTTSYLEIYNELKSYRLNTSRKEGIKPYFIFNNEELELLIQSKPKTKAELLKVKGFGVKKVEKYGDEILRIVNGKEE